MITSILKGGLGNQLFQIAAGLSLSYDVGTEFCVSDQETVDRTRYFTSNYTETIFRNLKRKNLKEVFGNFKVWNEPSSNYFKIPKTDWLILDGYFQSEKYFKRHEKQIRDFFPIEKILLPKKTVALHIRRGDYLKVKDFHYILPIDYYKNALDLVGSYEKLLVFMRDAEIPKEFNFPNMEIINTGKDYLDFSIMANCETIIMANSTFSWWASWLNSNENKKIIMPFKWFGPRGIQNYTDIFVDGWKVIQ